MRLSDVPIKLRQSVVDQVVSRAGLSAIEALEWALAAVSPSQDPVIFVSTEKARIVLEEGKLPPGPMPDVWRW